MRSTTATLIATMLGAAVLTIGTPGTASAATTCTGATATFDGSADGSWDVAGNWAGNAVPSAADHVCIPVGKSVVVSDAPPTVDDVAIEGALHVTTGTLTATNGTRTLTASGNGTIHVDATGTISAPVVALQDQGVLTLAGGTLSGDLETDVSTLATAWGTVGGQLRNGGRVIVGEHLGTTARTLHVNSLIFTPAGSFVIDWLGNGGVPGTDSDLVEVSGNVDYYAGTFEIDNPTRAKLGDGKMFTPITYAHETCAVPNVSLNGVPGVSLVAQVHATSTSIISSGTAPAPPSGYWLATASGQVLGYGTEALGSMAGTTLNAPIVDVVATPSGGGYWLLASDGGVFAFGDAGFYGSTAETHLNAPITAMAATKDGHGYWLAASDGGVFAFGNARFSGSAAELRLNAPIVGIAADPDGGGYWLAGADGGVFAYDAVYAGSAGSAPLKEPVAAIAADSDGGYWLVASDGGVFAYDAAFVGSAANLPLNGPVVDLLAADDGHGYRLAGSDGGVFAFNTDFAGSAAGIGRVVGIAGFGDATNPITSSTVIRAAC